MAAPGFDMQSLQSALEDPEIKKMAEQIANDPTFREVTQQLQSNLQGLMGAGGMPADPSQFMTGFDPSKYMEAMKGMFANPQFMNMAESLGKKIIDADPGMSQMVATMQDPSTRSKVEEAMKGLKDDPDLKPILEELETSGPMGMMKYWNDPEVLAKLGKAMGGAMGSGFDMSAMLGRPEGAEAVADGEEEEGEGEEEEEETTVLTAASAGNVEDLQQLLEAGADANEKDEEGRTGLHFACGYGELPCAEALLKHKADINAVDNNSNTALHYAAGYGQAESVTLLVQKGADKAILNKDGKTALEVAELNGHAEIVAALK